MPNGDVQQPIDQSLRRLLQRVRRYLLQWGIVRVLALGGPAVLAAAWVAGGVPRPSPSILWGLALSLLVLVTVIVWRFLGAPWGLYRDEKELARRVEAGGDFANLLVAAEEAGRRPDRWDERDDLVRELRHRVDRRAAGIIADLTPARIHPLARRRWAAWGAAFAFGLAVLLGVTAPRDMVRGMGRLLAPAAGREVLITGGLYGQAEREFVVAGDDVTLAAFDFAHGDGRAVCEVRFGDGGWQELAAESDVSPNGATGRQVAYRRWKAVVPEVREDFTWRFRRGALVSDALIMEVKHPPLLTGLAARVVPPTYTRLPAQDLDRLPTWFEVPAGSRLELTGRVNHPVVSAQLQADPGDTLEMRADSTAVTAVMTIARTTGFTVGLVDGYGLANVSPLRYEVAAAADQAPAVALRREGDDGILPLAGELQLAVEAADDFGLVNLALLLRIVGAGDDDEADGTGWRGGTVWPVPDAESRELTTSAGALRVRSDRVDNGVDDLRLRLGLQVNAQALDLVPGDVAELVIEATDNKRPRPPNRARSRVLRLVLPSAAEVLTAQAEASEERQGELEEMRRRSRELDVDLDRLTRELMKNPVPDWARQQEMEGAIQRQQTLQEELARVAAELRRELEKLAESQLTSEAQLERAEQMNQLLAQQPSAGLQDLMRRMEESGEQISPADINRAMAEAARQQKDMARRLDAALSLLKRMAQEQELAGLVALLEKMIQKQQELADLSRQLAEKEAEEAAAEADESGSSESEPGDDEQPPGADGETDAESGDPTEDANPTEGAQEGEESGRDPAEDSAGEDHAEGQPPAGEESETGDASSSPQDQAAPPSSEELARRQKALEEELEQLMEKLSEALAELQKQNADDPRESGEQMEQALRQALEQLEEQQKEGGMDKAAQMLEQMDPGQAAQQQEQALRDLASLYSVLLKSQQAMQMAMQMEQVASLRGLAADLLAMSARQEEIGARIPPGLRDVRSLELTRDQHRLQKAADVVRRQLAGLMEDAPNRIMRLLEKLDDLIEEMGSGVRAMEENRATAARSHARNALAAANRIVIGLLTEAQMSGSGGGSGSSMPSMSEQLQQMIQEQAGLNGATDELRRMLANRGLSQEMRSQMQRLGEQQAGLARQMGELAEEERERPEGERLLGDIAEMGRDMESIGQELDDGLVSEETLERQERILSRMLDARNSVRQRDYTTRRESRAADDLYAEQDGRAGPDDGAENSPFRRRYQPLEKAPLEYRDLVRRYFAALDSLRDLSGEATEHFGEPRGDAP